MARPISLVFGFTFYSILLILIATRSGFTSLLYVQVVLVSISIFSPSDHGVNHVTKKTAAFVVCGELGRLQGRLPTPP